MLLGAALAVSFALLTRLFNSTDLLTEEDIIYIDSGSDSPVKIRRSSRRKAKTAIADVDGDSGSISTAGLEDDFEQVDSQLVDFHKPLYGFNGPPSTTVDPWAALVVQPTTTDPWAVLVMPPAAGGPVAEAGTPED